jgi:hypothetical protein
MRCLPGACFVALVCLMSAAISAALAPPNPPATMGADEREMYEHPLVKRYATKEMSYIWSPEMKFSTWRRLWVALAKAEKELGECIGVPCKWWARDRHAVS